MLIYSKTFGSPFKNKYLSFEVSGIKAIIRIPQSLDRKIPEIFSKRLFYLSFRTG
jgi:hypothetical protein